MGTRKHPTPKPGGRARHEPLYDVDPRTGVIIEVFFSDRSLETFGRCGSGWFWWPRRRGLSPEGAATGPVRYQLRSVPTRYEYDRGDPTLIRERLANRASLSVCQEWDMDEPTHDATASESLVFTSIF